MLTAITTVEYVGVIWSNYDPSITSVVFFFTELPRAQKHYTMHVTNIICGNAVQVTLVVPRAVNVTV